jgi:nitric oxide dioxygenase
VTYGVRPNDYRTMGSALLWTLELGLGKDFTANTKLAWLEFYNLLADTMKRAS